MMKSIITRMSLNNWNSLKIDLLYALELFPGLSNLIFFSGVVSSEWFLLRVNSGTTFISDQGWKVMVPIRCGPKIGARLEVVYFSLFGQTHSTIWSQDEPVHGSLVVSVSFIPVPDIFSLKLSFEIGALNDDSLFLINVPKNRLIFGIVNWPKNQMSHFIGFERK